jgi:hypothetical protein
MGEAPGGGSFKVVFASLFERRVGERSCYGEITGILNEQTQTLAFFKDRCCKSGMFILDPDFYPSRNPGQLTKNNSTFTQKTVPVLTKMLVGGIRDPRSYP